MPGQKRSTASDKSGARLKSYRAKRDPAKTPEPMGEPDAAAGLGEPDASRFVIQEHHARALHWDFRLERGGVLVSWALPKGLPVDPKTNHLAVHTEDHPLEYGGFEGDIPKGEYGGGHVEIWDRGTYDLEKWSDREVKVVLHGARAEGRYVLFPTGGKNWMIHRMDPAPEGFEPMPERIAPMLALAGALPKDDTAWAYEFKWDGVRAIVFVEGGRVRATSRNDKDLAGSFPELRSIGEFLGSRSAILDGEIVAFDESGRPSFGRLQHRLHLGSRAEVTKRSHDVAVSYIAFDLLYLDGRSLLALPYDDRRKMLESLHLAADAFATSPSFVDRPGADVLAAAKDAALEGVVAKRRGVGLPAREPPGRLDQDQALPDPGGRDRRLDRRQRGTGREPGRPAPGGAAGRRPRLRRQSGDGVRRGGASRAPRRARAPGRDLEPFHEPPEPGRDRARPFRPPRGGGRGAVRGVDRRRPSPSPVVARVAPRQGSRRGRP